VRDAGQSKQSYFAKLVRFTNNTLLHHFNCITVYKIKRPDQTVFKNISKQENFWKQATYILITITEPIKR